MPRKEKELIVDDLSNKIINTNGVVLTDYQGLTVAEISELRTKLRPLKCEYKVIKNTLSKLALKKAGIENFDEYFIGPTAVAIEKGDPVSAAKVLIDFSKEHNKLKLKAGLLGKKVLTIEDIKSLASLPSREVLIATLLGTMKAPITNFVGVLAAVPRSLVYVLEAVRKQKEAVNK
jgi:large subunit ribosomal protein L10